MKKVKTILDENPNLVNLEDSDGNRPIFKILYIYAMSKANLNYLDGNFEKYLKLLSSYDLELNFVTGDILTPLQISVLLPIKNSDKFYLFEKLQEAGGDINFSDEKRKLPYILLTTIDEENYDIFLYLLSKNVDLSHYLFWNLYNLAELTNFKINSKNIQESDLLRIVKSKEYKNHR